MTYLHPDTLAAVTAAVQRGPASVPAVQSGPNLVTALAAHIAAQHEERQASPIRALYGNERV